MASWESRKASSRVRLYPFPHFCVLLQKAEKEASRRALMDENCRRELHEGHSAFMPLSNAQFDEPSQPHFLCRSYSRRGNSTLRHTSFANCAWSSHPCTTKSITCLLYRSAGSNAEPTFIITAAFASRSSCSSCKYSRAHLKFQLHRGIIPIILVDPAAF